MSLKLEELNKRYPGWEVISRGPVHIAGGLTRMWLKISEDDVEPEGLVDAITLEKRDHGRPVFAHVRFVDLEPVGESDRLSLATKEASPGTTATEPPDDAAEEALKCTSCDHLCREEEVESPLYSCDNCGTEYDRDGSMDGMSNRCPECNRFGAKLSDWACPDCSEGEMVKVWVIEQDDGELEEVSA